MYRNKIVNFQKSTRILDAYSKKSGNLFKAPRIFALTSLVLMALFCAAIGSDSLFSKGFPFLAMSKYTQVRFCLFIALSTLPRPLNPFTEGR